MEPWSLGRTAQCKNCPWRKDSDVSKIPGYSAAMHAEKLAETIARGDGDLRPTRVMACHEHPEGEEEICIGWLVNQLRNNNLGIRIRMIGCENAGEIRTVGPQHATFEETLPKKLRPKTRRPRKADLLRLLGVQGQSSREHRHPPE